MFQSGQGDSRILPNSAVRQPPQRMEQHPAALLHKDRQTARRPRECGVGCNVVGGCGRVQCGRWCVVGWNGRVDSGLTGKTNWENCLKIVVLIFESSIPCVFCLHIHY